MSTCQTCRHWHREPRSWLWDRVTGEEVLDDSLPGKCLLAGSRNGYADHPKSKAMAQDAESYAAGLRTAPDFGCVQHQPQGAS